MENVNTFELRRVYAFCTFISWTMPSIHVTIPAVPAIGDDVFCKCTYVTTRLRRNALNNLSNMSDIRSDSLAIRARFSNSIIDRVLVDEEKNARVWLKLSSARLL